MMQTHHEQTTDGMGVTTMRAVTQRAYGSSDVLQVGRVDRPAIAADEVLIKVAAAGLDRGVWHLMTGRPYLIRIMGYGFSRPKGLVPGMDVAGRVAAVGDDVTRFSVGDEVFGIGTGTFAEFAAAKESKLVLKPDTVSDEEAAASAISGITALQALTTVGRLEGGQNVLIIGASGGVGSFAVQIAKALGATVTGVASTSKLDVVRTLGADDVIDYTCQHIDDGERRYDLIIDTGGRNPLSRLRRALTATGTLVIVGGEGGDRLTGGIGRQLGAALLSLFVRQRLTFFVSSESREDIERLAEYLANGAVTAAIGQQFTLEEVPGAIAAMEAGTLTAKAVITVHS
ncbi:NAD(P)-dependent alcohol dehydrogenase [uncultured Serinicoccus sp.]|uniref:NAD(P)-dependent alcohol dehydrogenase n=1 Tax=uncultured Serinicoccus sp. TaxID=735514 RepID=UPI00261EB248|nr:NAD(P)-dependent alcohol dehydrogenase [uncultured Serinicoccus sp.]